jgi:dihydropteroate synthase
MKNPPMTFSSFFNKAQEDWLSIQEHYGTPFLWHKDQDVREEIMREGMSGIDSCDDSDNELDAILKETGLSFSKDILVSYIIDALSRNESSPEKVEEKLLRGRYLYEKDRKTISGLLNKLWEEVRIEYYASLDPYIKDRRRLLKANDSIITLLRDLDAATVDPDKLIKNDAFLHFNELSAMVSHLIILLNNLGDTTIKETMVHLSKIEKTVTELIGVVREEFLSSNNNPNILQFPKRDENKIYQLKISLKYTKPPIWRRILVPANMELENLHETIQCVMKWYNCHLHQFMQGNICYQPNPEPEEDMFFMSRFDTVDSSGVKINDLLTCEKEKIKYEYDFGDSWIHEIMLEKIVEREENTTYPVCIKGKRACPPEDCGGIPGYYSILNDSGFMDKETRDYYMEEIGDPELFDINEVNARLKRCVLDEIDK